MTEQPEESATLQPSLDGGPPMYRFASEMTQADVDAMREDDPGPRCDIDTEADTIMFSAEAERAQIDRVADIWHNAATQAMLPHAEEQRTDWQSSELMGLGAIIPQTPPTMPPLSLPEDDATRALYPMADGCLDYFPNALAEVSKISYEGNLKHNPGQPMHWNRGKSLDHRNKIIRHTVESKGDSEQAIYHAAQTAWRALADLQQKIERVRGAPMSPGSRA